MSLHMAFRAVLALTLALGCAAAGQGATLAERAAAIDAPSLGSELKLAAPLQIGRAEITPAAGARVRVLLAHDTPCGFAIDGPARLRYRVEDRFSVPVAERNVRRASSLSAKPSDQGLEITTDLSGAVVWGWELGQEGATAATTGAALPPWAAKILAGRRFPPPSHDLLDAEANGVQGMRYALLRGGEENLLLRVDPRAAEENLSRVARATDPGTSFREGMRDTLLASQPVGRAWWDRPLADMVAEQERLAIENPAGAQLRIAFSSRLRARRADLALWRADLVDRVYDDDGGRHLITVRSVRVDGRAAGFLHQDHELLVPLGRALAADETVEVEVTYEGKLAQLPEGNAHWMLGTGPWYPRPAGPAGERATIEITVDVPEAWTPFASGAEVARTAQAGRRKLTTRLEQPMRYAVVAAGKYRVLEETSEGVTCRAATYAMLKEDAARRMIAGFFSARRFFEQLFDTPFPFRDLTIVEINSWGFGQAPPNLIFFTREFYTAPVDRRNRIYFQDRDARFLHEVAHGWWGHVVKIGSLEDVWLTEAFADYTAALAVWKMAGEKHGQAKLEKIVQDWTKAAGELGPGASLYLMSRLASHDERDYLDHLRLRYGKGPLVLHALRLELQRQKGSPAEGDRYFMALLRSYVKRSRDGWGTTHALVEELDQLTGGTWQPWFERYVYGTEIPQLPR